MKLWNIVNRLENLEQKELDHKFYETGFRSHLGTLLPE